MRLIRCLLPVALALLAGPQRPGRSDDKADVKETAIAGPNGLTVTVRMEGPYTADVPLQIVCYFKYTPEGARRMEGAPVELDKKLGGVIASLRGRGEFVGDEGDTLLLVPPRDAIKARALLLVGLGDEGALSLQVMERVGRVSLREAARFGVGRVAFAPLVRDQGNTRFSTGNVAGAVLRGALLAYETERRLQKEGLAKEFTLKEWVQEAGPRYFDDTVAGARKAIEEARAAAARRPAEPYGSAVRK